MGAQIGVPSGPGPGHIYRGTADGSRGKLIPVSRVPINITTISKYRIQDDLLYLRGISTIWRAMLKSRHGLYR